jgi:hypothetical protein
VGDLGGKGTAPFPREEAVMSIYGGLMLAQEQLKNSLHPFYGVVLDKQPIPLGKINLSVTFRNVSNYHTKTLTFEVVDFSGPYHIILG